MQLFRNKYLTDFIYPCQPLEELQNLPDNFNFDDPSFVEANRARLEEITLRDPDAFLRIGLIFFYYNFILSYCFKPISP